MRMLDMRAGLRRGLIETATVIGTFVKIDDCSVVDIAHTAGLDFVVIDAEHSQLGDDSVRQLLGYACALGFPALVRIPTLDIGYVNRALEAGAVGIQLSNVVSRKQVDDLKMATRYAPSGKRSISLAHSQADYGRAGIPKYLAGEVEQPPVLVVQIESPNLSDPLDHIVRGVDVAFHGPTDMSVALGDAGATDGEAYRSERIRLRDAARDAGVPTGSWVADRSSLDMSTRWGDRYTVIGSDLQILASGLRTLTPASESAPTYDPIGTIQEQS
ncbi:HpcH/HpaI aldolase family protein [Rhodococcus sp. ACPA4]|uniref:HpcH/HpaI aldolase family protein n=1 Tax=Rhodococcus sp. ACPA4 TaxID=2028571 RepID=UPI0015CC52E3|nr:aldolase/citrate lyase family protein [Rhodococcus sp. ACPA4]